MARKQLNGVDVPHGSAIGTLRMSAAIKATFAATVVGAAVAGAWYFLKARKAVATAAAESQATPASTERRPSVSPAVATPGLERTFVMLKPEALQRKQIGRIIEKLESRGYRLVALKMFSPSEAHWVCG